MEIDNHNHTEATMQAATPTGTSAPRYGYQPQVMFAATRAGAERRARETAAAAALDTPSSTRYAIRRLVTASLHRGRRSPMPPAGIEPAHAV